jgi:hypothetical protein
LRIPRIEAGIVQRKLQQVSDNPTNPRNAEKAKKILIDARTTGLKIQDHVVRDTGIKFIETAGNNNPDAWGAAMQFLAYRSFLNENAAPLLKRTYDCSAGYRSTLLLDFAVLSASDLRNYKPTPARPEVTVECVRGKNLSPERTARLELLGVIYNFPGIPKEQQLPPPGPNTEIAFYRVSVGWGVALNLSNMYMKNVIIENTTVEYDGEGPLILDNVWFVNCQFVLPQNDNARQFSNAILASAPVSFRSTHS